MKKNSHPKLKTVTYDGAHHLGVLLILLAVLSLIGGLIIGVVAMDDYGSISPATPAGEAARTLRIIWAVSGVASGVVTFALLAAAGAMLRMSADRCEDLRRILLELMKNGRSDKAPSGVILRESGKGGPP